MKKTILLLTAINLFGLSGYAQTPEAAPSPETVSVSKPDNPQKAATPNANGYVRPSGNERLKRYLKSMFGPVALATRAAQAGFGTWTNSPEEWGDTWEGFGRRYASRTAGSIIKNSTMYGLDEVLKVDSNFYRSKKRDVGSRIKNALISPVTARRGDGSRTIGIPKLAGIYTSAIIASETWMPERYSWKNGVKAGTISLGFDVGWNLAKEFIFKKGK